jgi:transposase
MPPNYVEPYVKRQKNDAADAEAICEAVTRSTRTYRSGALVAARAMLRRTGLRRVIVICTGVRAVSQLSAWLVAST